ncbi:MAG: PD-(D/E)XK nuclease family protein [Fibromonadaceae bacterium]|nr:PD-(D/E)XK nuclease family protein [Fibromonadaceae bacterium]
MRIRASMLPSYNDCPRRAVARQFRSKIEKAGFFLNPELPSIGAVVGTTTHSVVEAFYFSSKKLENFNEENAITEAMEALKNEAGKGCIWDDSTPSVETAEKQIKRMVRVYIEELGKNLTPVATELELVADLDDGWELSGHIDLLAKDKEGKFWLRDLKTGSVSRSHHAQLGAYSLLYHTAPPDGLPKKIEGGAIDFVKRTPKTRPQDSIKITEYNLALCERTAWATIQKIKSDMALFDKTTDPFVFPENSMSMLCNKTYCVAHNTDFCPITKEKE